MDIDFFKETGDFGEEAPNHGNFTFVTTEAEANYLSILQMRGFLDDLAPKDILASATRQWNQTRLDLPAPLSTTEFSPTLTLPVGTELHLSLLGTLGVFWGKATLAGQSINAARKQITKYLMLGRYTMAHSGGAALLNHVTNTPLRDSLKIKKAKAPDDLAKPITGTLYFRAVPIQEGASLPVAPDAAGKTMLSTWQDDVSAFVDQAKRALQEVQTQGGVMVADLSDLERIRRVLAAIWDIGLIGTIREYPNLDVTDPANVLSLGFRGSTTARFARGFLRDVLTPASPGGHFGFDWTLANTEVGKTFAWIQTRRAAPYKTLADHFHKAPAAYIELATSVCNLEIQMLWERAADGDQDKVVRAEMESAADWLDKQSGEPPDSAGGAGILLGMLRAIPPGIPRPAGLLRLAWGVMTLHGTLSAAEGDTRTVREARLKGALGRLLDLPGAWVGEFRKSTTWDFVLSAATVKKGTTILVRVPGPAEKGAKTLIEKMDDAADETAKQMSERIARRLEELDRAARGSPVAADKIVLAISEESEEAQPKIQALDTVKSQMSLRIAKLTKVMALFRVIGFLASTWQVGDDFGKLLVDRKEGEAVKLAKDLVSTVGTVARDYFNTRLALDPTLTAAEKDALIAGSKGLFAKRIGSGFGVAIAVWTGYEAWQKHDVILGGAALCNGLGWGVRMIGRDVAWELFGVLTLELSVPLIAVGAALELWASAQPTPPDETIKKQTLNMLRGVVHAMTTWYARRHKDVPWRAIDVPELESALQKYEQDVGFCDQEQRWSVFLPCDKQDASSMRLALTRIGFSASEASQLVADETLAKYMFRGTWQGLPISQRQWAPLE